MRLAVLLALVGAAWAQPTRAPTMGRCFLGQYWSGGCRDCPPGKFGDTDNTVPPQTSCRDCSVGKFAAAARASSCDDCSPGSFSGVSAAIACTACAQDTFASLPGAVACSACSTNFVTIGTGATECYQVAGQVQAVVSVVVESDATCVQLSATAGDLRNRLAAELNISASDIEITVSGCGVIGRRLLASVSLEIHIKTNTSAVSSVVDTLETVLVSAVADSITAQNLTVTNTTTFSTVSVNRGCVESGISCPSGSRTLNATCDGECMRACCEDFCVPSFGNFVTTCACEPNTTDVENCSTLCTQYAGGGACRAGVEALRECVAHTGLGGVVNQVLSTVGQCEPDVDAAPALDPRSVSLLAFLAFLALSATL